MKKPSCITDMLGIAIEPTYFDLENHNLNCSKIVTAAKDIGANSLRVGMFSHQGHAYYPSAVAPMAPFLKGRNLLKEFEDTCRSQNIRLIVYLNSKWVVDLYKEHPDWAILLKTGLFKFPDAAAEIKLYPMCPNSPFMDYFEAIIREVVTQSSPDGIYIDNFGIEPFCQCDFCRQKFGAKIPERTKWRSRETQRYRKWLLARQRQIARRIVVAARSKNPEQPVVFNYGIFWSDTGKYSPEDNFVMAHEIADGVHAESAVRFHGDSFEHINHQCTMGRAINVPIWTWVEYSMLPFSYASCTAQETKLKAAKVLANGGRPMVWNMPCAPFVDMEGMRGVKEVFKIAGENASIFNNVKFEKFAAILFSSSTIREYCQGELKREWDNITSTRMGRLQESFMGAQKLMILSHQPYDFILDSDVTFDKLKQYKVLLLPNVTSLTKAQCDAIRQYVRQGGSVFATNETSLHNLDGRVRRNFALKDLLGAKYVHKLGPQLEGYCAGYAKFFGDHPIAANFTSSDLLPLGGDYLAIESEKGIATILERCRYYCDHLQSPTKFPACVTNCFGKGKVVYVPGEFFSFFHQKQLQQHRLFFGKSLEWLVNGQLAIITNLPATVELTVTHTRMGKTILHLINGSFEGTQPIEEIPPITGRYLKLRRRKKAIHAIDLITNKKIDIEKDGGYLLVKLPSLTGYNPIVIG
jgi:hypothetical protein